MNLAHILPTLAATLIIATPSLSADPCLSIHTRLFALDAAATTAARIEPDSPVPPTATAARLLHAPATIRWGEARLDLLGDTVNWTPADRLPPGFKLIADTTLPVGPTGNAVLRCIARVQYMERLPEGTFALRSIEADAPDAPRYVLAFKVAPQSPTTTEFAMRCRPEIAVAHRRTPVDGVNIPVGKPLVDVFSDELRFTARQGEWTALLMCPPAPFESGALVLFKIDSSPSPSTATEPPHKRDRTLTMSIAATRTPAESPAVRPAPDAPVGYLLYDGGYGDYGEPMAGTRPPAAGPIRATWQDALLHAGYRPAGADLPPRLVLVYYSGVTRAETKTFVYNLATGDAQFSRGDTSSTSTSLHEKAFVTISAFDHTDFVAGFRTLLWRVQAETRDVANLSEVLPALITASTSWLGQDQANRSTAKVQLANQRVVTQGPTENDSAAARKIDEDRVHALIEKERRIITSRHYFAVSADDRVPHTPLPTGKR